MIRVAIAGAGRMGKAIAAGLDTQSDLELVGTWARGDDLDALVRAADVVVDFSLPDGTMQVLEAAADIPVVYDRNMSLGIAVLARSVRDAAASLGMAFEVEIAEVHHVHKKDAPSGTALKLGEIVAAARGERGTGSVRFHSERRGEVPGDHEVVMTSATERLSFAHSVTTRQVFADGAIRAARWVVAQPPGRYGMSDVLFGN